MTQKEKLRAYSEKYELVVGLEVHAQLLTKSKAFAPDSAEYGGLPNTHVSVVTLAHPGILPKFNKKAINFAVKMGLACGCRISRHNFFDRKNYFYPDLPKGFQLTQDKTPICIGGAVTVASGENSKRPIQLNRIHMEEDAGKSLHLAGNEETLVDLNRAGVPLIEIVTEPDIHTPEEAYQFVGEIRKLVRYLEICDGNMEEGSMRCDANISVRLHGDKELGKKSEVKNMNSMRNVQRAIESEFVRQVEALEAGEPLLSETRTFNAEDGTTTPMRSKEALNDYRYFPEPDLPPFEISDEYLDGIRAEMPALPHELFAKFTGEFGLPDYDAGVLTDAKDIALFFDHLCTKTDNFKAASNWVMGPVKSYLNELTLGIEKFPLSAERIAEIIALTDEGKVSFSTASRDLFKALLDNPKENALAMAEKMQLIQDSSEDSILPFIEAAIAKYPDKVAAYKNGKTALLGLFMGEVMKAAKGKADPKTANKLVKEALDKA